MALRRLPAAGLDARYPGVLLGQLATWLIVAYVGFALLLWPFAARGVVSAFIDAGSSLFTLGFAEPAGTAPAVLPGLVLTAARVGPALPTASIAITSGVQASDQALARALFTTSQQTGAAVGWHATSGRPGSDRLPVAGLPQNYVSLRIPSVVLRSTP